jgi:hypothetical protein
MNTSPPKPVFLFQQPGMDLQVHRSQVSMRALFAITSLLCVSGVWAATLERLSIDDMSQKSTVIIRGRINSCTGEQKGSGIFTRCRVSVTERWKGTAAAQIDFFVPGGTARGFTQVFTGTPNLASGSEYVLFLWAGRSGGLQVIGLSQGVFDVKSEGTTVKREPTTERMLNAAGQPIKDEGVEMSVAALKQRVQRAVGGPSK